MYYGTPTEEYQRQDYRNSLTEQAWRDHLRFAPLGDAKPYVPPQYHELTDEEWSALMHKVRLEQWSNPYRSQALIQKGRA